MEMIFDFFQEIVKGFQAGHMPDLGTWNYLLVAGFMMLQGRVSALLSGAAAAAGTMNLGLIILVALSARVIVDVFWYRVGATGYIDRIGRRFGPYERVADRVQEGIHAQPVRFMVMAKVSNGSRFQRLSPPVGWACPCGAGCPFLSLSRSCSRFPCFAPATSPPTP